MTAAERLDPFLRRHPRLFLAGLCLLTIVVVIVLELENGSTGPVLVYQTF